MWRRYDIAGIGIAISQNEFLEGKIWELFIDNSQNLPNFFVEIQKEIREAYCNVEIFDNMVNDEYLIRMDKIDIMRINQSWTFAKILPLQSRDSISKFLLQIFYTHGIEKNMLEFHSSLIQFYNNGLMFLGPSGIGKTTQAELWNKYRDALIINGDIVFVQETPDDFLGWGTPWHGSSPYCENTNVPLKAMIILKQAPENSIRELTGFEKVTAVSTNVFYPRWLENGMELCLETLNHLLTSVPVYELSCLPDGFPVCFWNSRKTDTGRSWPTRKDMTA